MSDHDNKKDNNSNDMLYVCSGAGPLTGISLHRRDLG